MACASFLPDNEAWSSGHLAASVRAVVLLTTAPASRKRLGVDRSLVRALASVARHGDGADEDDNTETPRSASLAPLPHKIRMITEDAFARCSICRRNSVQDRPFVKRRSRCCSRSRRTSVTDWATSRGRSWPTSWATARLEPLCITTSSPRPRKVS